MLPVLLGAIVFFAAPIVLWQTTLSGSGDVTRWAAISTMWLLIPVMIAGLVLLALLIVLTLITGRISGWIPRYSLRAQRLAGHAASGTRRAGQWIRRPVLVIEELKSLAKRRIQRLRERV